MTSQKQIEANQHNCQKSSGPVTLNGKSIVSRNAVKHGILSSKVPIDVEEGKDFQEFASELHRLFLPTDALQCLLVDRIISNAWRLRRIVHIETLTLTKAMQTSWGDRTYQDIFTGNTGQSMAILSRYERSLENSLFRALRELREIKEAIGIDASSITCL